MQRGLVIAQGRTRRKKVDMAIFFEVRLTVNQIQCLKCIDRIEQTGHFSSAGVPDWWKGTRYLLSEKFISHEKDCDPTEAERKQGYQKAHRWALTEKGKYLLRLIELDIIDAAEAVRRPAIDSAEVPVIEGEV